MQVYQVDASVSNRGIITLPSMPYLYNKKVKLVIIPTENNTAEYEQRELALERLFKRQETMSENRWTDDDLDSFKHERLSAKYV